MACHGRCTGGDRLALERDGADPASTKGGGTRWRSPAIFAVIALARAGRRRSAAEELRLVDHDPGRSRATSSSRCWKAAPWPPASPTAPRSRAQVIFSRKVMDEILQIGGWLEDNPIAAARRTACIEEIKDRTIIRESRARTWSRSRYRDSDPHARLQGHRAPGRARSSRKAWPPRNAKAARPTSSSIAQVEDYHKKLTDAEDEPEAIPRRQCRRASRQRAPTPTPASARCARRSRQARSTLMELRSHEAALHLAAVRRIGDHRRADARGPCSARSCSNCRASWTSCC